MTVRRTKQRDELPPPPPELARWSCSIEYTANDGRRVRRVLDISDVDATAALSTALAAPTPEGRLRRAAILTIKVTRK